MKNLAGGQFPGGKYLDDLNPDELTAEQKQALTDLLAEDPYAFYNLFRDPDAAQRMIEGDDFKTVPAADYFGQIGALRMAGAPEDVMQYWREELGTHNRPGDNSDELFPPKTKPIPEKLQQIDDFCKNINEELNRTDDYRYNPAHNFVPEDHPLSAKWAALMRFARGEPMVEKHNDGVATHYKATDPVLAHSGVEIVEITLTQSPVEIDLDSYKYTDDPLDAVLPNHINPYAMEVARDGDKTIIKLRYDGCYE